jgi:hypothetical protein
MPIARQGDDPVMEQRTVSLFSEPSNGKGDAMQVSFSIPMGGKGNAHATLFQNASGSYGLTLHDGSGVPQGKGRTLSERQARELAKAIEAVKPSWRAGLIWAALGYERHKRKAVASAICHPGVFRLTGRA